MTVEKELTTVAPEVRAQINELSKEVRNVPRETPEEKKDPQPVAENKPEASVQEVQQAQAEVQKGIEELTEEAETTSDPKKKGRAQERIQELVAQKNQLEEILNNYSRYNPLIEEYERTLQEQTKPKYSEMNQEELYATIKKEVLEEVRKEVQPIMVDSANAKYQKALNTWFDQNKDAQSVKNQMDEFSKTLTPEEVGFYQKQIMAGNYRPLEMIYKTVKPQPTNTGAMQKAIQADQQKAGVTTSKKSSKAAEENSSFDDDLSYAVKKRDFRSLIKKHIL